MLSATMNSTSSILMVGLNSTASTTALEPWFIPLGIIILLFNTLVIILSIFYLLIILLDKTCYTVLMMLTANTCISAFVLGCVSFSLIFYTFISDFKGIQYEDSLCQFRGYMAYVSAALFNYSFIIQALYRYLAVIYPKRLFFQSIRFQLSVVCLTWIFDFIYPLVFFLKGEYIYNSDDHICLLPFRLSFAMIFVTVCLYTIPVSMIQMIYFLLVRYVKKVNTRVVSVNTLHRARRHLKMVRHIATLITLLLVVGFPYAALITMSFFTSSPKYHNRIAHTSHNTALLCTMIALFYFTDLLKTSLIKRITRRNNNTVIPAIA